METPALGHQGAPPSALTAIIPTRNRLELLRDCLQILADQALSASRAFVVDARPSLDGLRGCAFTLAPVNATEPSGDFDLKVRVDVVATFTCVKD